MTTTTKPETKRERIERLRATLVSERDANFRPHWQELGNYLLPRGVRFDAMAERNRGHKVNQKIINARATLALRTMQHGMMSGITSPARPWFRLTTPDPELAEFARVKQWLHGVTRRLNEIFARSNFYHMLSGMYRHLGAFATAVGMIEEGEPGAPDGGRDIIRCYRFPIGSYVLATGPDGRVDTFIRQFTMTVRQVVMRFGDPKAPPSTRWAPFSTYVKQLWDAGEYEKPIEVVHAIMPNLEHDPRYFEARFKRFASCYYELGAREMASPDRDKFLRESGYDEFPILAPRWDLESPDDVYGTSCPGMDALGDIKQLQLLEKRKAQAVEKAYNPPLVGPAELKHARVSSLPGDVTYVNVREGVQGLKPLYEVKPDISGLLEDIQKREELISRAFFEDVFLMLAMDARAQPPTAEEIRARHEEKLLMLGPVLDRLNDELYNPAIDIAFGILRKRGTFDPGMPLEPPEELQGMELRVEYISIMHQAQKLIATGAIDRFVSTVAQLGAVQVNAGQKPTALDKLDMDQVIDEYADITGVPPKIVVSDEAVARIRASRAQTEAAAAAAAQAEQLAKTGKTLADTSLEGDSALTRLLGVPA